MKKLLLVFVLVFSFVTLSAKVVNVPGTVTYQQAVNYCRSINMRLMYTYEIMSLLEAATKQSGSSKCSPLTFIGGNNQTVSVGSNCKLSEVGLGKENATYQAMCIGQ